MTRKLIGLTVGILVAATAWSFASAEPQSLMQRFTPVSDQLALNPNRNDWLMWRRAYDSWGYSPLNQINKDNIGQLQLAWAITQEPGNQEAAPLVHDGIMYLAQSNNIVHALDATNGDLIWEYEHPLPKMEGSYVKRQLVRARNSIALYGDRVFLTTGDARVIALNARTGEVIWNVRQSHVSPASTGTGERSESVGAVTMIASPCDPSISTIEAFSFSFRARLIAGRSVAAS